MTRNIMVDLETLSTHKSAVILQIGAVMFDPHGDPLFDSLLGARINTLVEVDDQIKLGRHVEGGTLQFWAAQDQKLFSNVLSGTPSDTLCCALHRLGNFISVNDIVWAGPTHFDVAILEHAYDALSIPRPWSHRNVRDLRTLRDVAARLCPQLGFDDLPPGQSHNALSDAVWQARVVMRCNQALATLGVVG